MTNASIEEAAADTAKTNIGRSQTHRQGLRRQLAQPNHRIRGIYRIKLPAERVRLIGNSTRSSSTSDAFLRMLKTLIPSRKRAESTKTSRTSKRPEAIIPFTNTRCPMLQSLLVCIRHTSFGQFPRRTHQMPGTLRQSIRRICRNPQNLLELPAGIDQSLQHFKQPHTNFTTSFTTSTTTCRKLSSCAYDALVSIRVSPWTRLATTVSSLAPCRLHSSVPVTKSDTDHRSPGEGLAFPSRDE